MQIVWLITKSLTPLIDALLVISYTMRYVRMNDLRNYSVRAGRSSNVFALRNLHNVITNQYCRGHGNKQCRQESLLRTEHLFIIKLLLTIILFKVWHDKENITKTANTKTTAALIRSTWTRRKSPAAFNELTSCTTFF